MTVKDESESGRSLIGSVVVITIGLAVATVLVLGFLFLVSEWV